MSFGRFKDDDEAKRVSGAAGSTSASGVAGGLSTVPSQGQVEAFLGRGSRVVGNLQFTGPVELDGQVEGEITAKDKLTIGEAAVISAKVSGAEIVVKGTVNGDIFASKRLSLRRPAKVTGNIVSSNLSIEEGVVFEGKCSMAPAQNSATTGLGSLGKSSEGTSATAASKASVNA